MRLARPPEDRYEEYRLYPNIRDAAGTTRPKAAHKWCNFYVLSAVPVVTLITFSGSCVHEVSSE